MITEKQEYNFINNVNLFLKAQGKTRQDIVREKNVSQPTLSSIWKNKSIKHRKFETIYKIADYTGISISALLNKSYGFKQMDKIINGFNL